MPVAVIALIAVLEAVGLIGYGGYLAVQGVVVGATGPADVSNVPAILLQVVIFLALGAGMLLVARGWHRHRRWARAPFVLAQLIGLLIGIPVAQSADAGPRIAGLVVALACLVGVVLALTPAATRALQEPRD